MASDRLRAVVIGAGAFGGWTALSLLRRGADVTLVDAWGPGHARSSSGGETRVLRRSYPGAASLRLAERARRLWLEESERSGRSLFEAIGLLWLVPEIGEVERLVLENLREQRIAHDWLERDRLAKSYPQIRTDDLEGALFEPEAGYLRARDACLAVREAFERQGGRFRRAWAEPEFAGTGEVVGVRLPDGSTVRADASVFAVGPWSGGWLADRLGFSLPVTRQEVFTFGTPPGDDRFGPEILPVWAFSGVSFWYGVPGDGNLGGFKVADDTRGPGFDPTRGDRCPSAEGIESARNFLADRFPAMAGAPLIGASVCQYTEAFKGRFLADRLPGAGNSWLIIGGSGHGFKHGPAVGEYLADLVLGDEQPGSDPAFSTVQESVDAASQ